jgi:HEPN domain-containing protein
MRRQAEAWLDSARDDLGVVEEIINRDDLTHMVAFHCQQSIEKSFKAVLEEYEKTVPRVHDLITLRNQVEKYVRLKVESDLLNQLNELYIDARYPSDIGLLPGGKPPKELAQKMYHFAREICKTIEESIT